MVHGRCVTFITLYREFEAYVDFHMSASSCLRGTVKLLHSLFIHKAQPKLQTPRYTPGIIARTCVRSKLCFRTNFKGDIRV
jgi:hypothetical protein